jgi:hypothetical protein
LGNSGADAGSTSTATVKIDTTPPYGVSFARGGLTDGASYYFGSVPAGPSSCSAQDDGSGFDHCSLSGYATSVGRQTVTATAYDLAGNSATATLNYTVLPWTLSGFSRPIVMSGAWNVVKAGSTIPLKFNIYADSAQLTDTADVVQPLTVTKVSCTDFSVLSVDTATTAGATSIRYDSTAGQFVYNWQTPSSSGSCYLLTVRTLDGSSLTAGFQLK